MVRLLLDHGSDLSQQDIHGDTADIIARRMVRHEISAFLAVRKKNTGVNFGSAA
jgi:ankyrin repeat protein